MARKQESLFAVLVWCPWWTGAALAIGVWAGIVFMLPGAVADFPVVGRQLGQAAERNRFLLATLAAAPFLICSWVSWRNGRRKRRLLDRRDGIASIRALSWREFEELVAEAFRREGYRVLENSKAGADGGIDIRLRKDGQLYLVQCKNWSSNRVGVGVVREMVGVMVDAGAAGVIIVCSGRFTRDAWAFARGKAVRLVDGRALMGMIARARR
ncbi:MAG: restriction endonuclease [Gemmatimonadetes bacterium]|nr:restriction endonuclease [Gemmatimonadota bacterium]